MMERKFGSAAERMKASLKDFQWWLKPLSNEELAEFYEHADVGKRTDFECWLNESIPFDHGLSLPDNHIETAKSLFQQLTKKGGYNLTNKQNEFFLLCANLLYSKRIKKPVSFPFNRNDWIPIKRYHRASYYTCETMRTLINKNLVLEKRGFRSAKCSRIARVWPSKSFYEHFEPINEMLCEPIELVNLLDENGNHIDYDETDLTERVRGILRQANISNRKAKVQYFEDGKALTLSTDLYAVYKNDFQHHGRLYTRDAGYQRLSSKKENPQRSRIRINHEPVVELDFSGLHPRLLYAREGIQYPHDADPYLAVIDDPDLRKPILKPLLLAILNADAEKNAVASGNYALKREYDKKQKWDKYNLLRSKNLTIKELVQEFKKAHAPIAKYFFTKVCMEVMNLDGQIALMVIDHFSRKEIPILAIHDSFIIQERFEQELMEVMQQAFMEISGGFTCPIK